MPNSQDDQLSPTRARRRRRSKHSNKKAEPGLIDHLRHPLVGQGLFALMVLTGIGHGWHQYREVSAVVGTSGALSIGMNRQQVSQAMGNIAGGDPAATSWRYALSGRTIDLTFDPQAGTLREVRCQEHDAASLACPRVLGISIGDDLEKIARNLGPGEERGGAQGQSLAYPAIGHSFEIIAGRVASISTSQPQPGSGIGMLALLRSIP